MIREGEAKPMSGHVGEASPESQEGSRLCKTGPLLGAVESSGWKASLKC